jgi:peptidyl-prolyl cis-trans isomerase C
MTRKGIAGLQTAGMLALTAMLVVLFAGCPPAEKGPVLAQVGSDKLTVEEFESLVPEGAEVTRENLPMILDRWVSNALMYAEAKRRGIDKEREIELYVDRLGRDYIVNAMLERLTETVSVSQAEVIEFFEENKDDFNYEVKMKRIVLTDSALASMTLWEIRQGGDFDKLAKERSQDQLLEAGQESRYFSRGVGDPRMGGDPDLEDVIFGLEVGQVSDVVTTQEGYQIVKLVEKKKVKSGVSLAEVKEYIEAVIGYRKSQELVNSTLTSLREDATITLTPEAYFD